MLVRSSSSWSFGGDVWQSGRLRLIVPNRWRPDADEYETPDSFEVIVDLAGVDEDDVEVQVFEDAIVVEGSRRVSNCHEEGVYHAAAIRQGPFRWADVYNNDRHRGRIGLSRRLLRITSQVRREMLYDEPRRQRRATPDDPPTTEPGPGERRTTPRR
jgi:hypothetical protein